MLAQFEFGLFAVFKENEPGMAGGMFPESSGFIFHIHFGKEP